MTRPANFIKVDTEPLTRNLSGVEGNQQAINEAIDGFSFSRVHGVLNDFTSEAVRQEVSDYSIDITSPTATDHGPSLNASIAASVAAGYEHVRIESGRYMMTEALLLSAVTDLGLDCSGAQFFVHPGSTPPADPDAVFPGSTIPTLLHITGCTNIPISGLWLNGNYDNTYDLNSFGRMALIQNSDGVVFKDFQFSKIKGQLRFEDGCSNCGVDGLVWGEQEFGYSVKFITVRSQIVGTGLNDILIKATAPRGQTYRRKYEIKISSVGAIDKYVWRKYTAGPTDVSWGTPSAWTTVEREIPALSAGQISWYAAVPPSMTDVDVPSYTAPQPLLDDSGNPVIDPTSFNDQRDTLLATTSLLSVSFQARTGHTLGDTWSFVWGEGRAISQPAFQGSGWATSTSCNNFITNSRIGYSNHDQEGLFINYQRAFSLVNNPLLHAVSSTDCVDFKCVGNTIGYTEWGNQINLNIVGNTFSPQLYDPANEVPQVHYIQLSSGIYGANIIGDTFRDFGTGSYTGNVTRNCCILISGTGVHRDIKVKECQAYTAFEDRVTYLVNIPSSTLIVTGVFEVENNTLNGELLVDLSDYAYNQIKKPRTLQKYGKKYTGKFTVTQLDDSRLKLTSADLVVNGTFSYSGNVAVTFTTPHGLTAGQGFYLQDIVGTTEANGFWETISIFDATTIVLDGSPYANTYVSGGTGRNKWDLAVSRNATVTLGGFVTNPGDDGNYSVLKVNEDTTGISSILLNGAITAASDSCTQIYFPLQIVANTDDEVELYLNTWTTEDATINSVAMTEGWRGVVKVIQNSAGTGVWPGFDATALTRLFYANLDLGISTYADKITTVNCCYNLQTDQYILEVSPQINSSKTGFNLLVNAIANDITTATGNVYNQASPGLIYLTSGTNNHCAAQGAGSRITSGSFQNLEGVNAGRRMTTAVGCAGIGHNSLGSTDLTKGILTGTRSVGVGASAGIDSGDNTSYALFLGPFTGLRDGTDESYLGYIETNFSNFAGADALITMDFDTVANGGRWVSINGELLADSFTIVSAAIGGLTYNNQGIANGSGAWVALISNEWKVYNSLRNYSYTFDATGIGNLNTLVGGGSTTLHSHNIYGLIAGQTWTGAHDWTGAALSSLVLEGQAARTISMARNTTANTAGNSFVDSSGGCTVGATDKDAGTRGVTVGASSGTGKSLLYLGRNNRAVSTGTADNAAEHAIYVPSPIHLPHDTATMFMRLGTGANMAGGGRVIFSVWAKDTGNESHVVSGHVDFSVARQVTNFVNVVAYPTLCEITTNGGASTMTLALTYDNTTSNTVVDFYIKCTMTGTFGTISNIVMRFEVFNNNPGLISYF